MYLNLSDIAIIFTENVDYCCMIYNISKSGTIHLLEISVLDDCRYILNACQRNQYPKLEYVTIILTIWSKQQNYKLKIF